MVVGIKGPLEWRSELCYMADVFSSHWGGKPFSEDVTFEDSSKVAFDCNFDGNILEIRFGAEFLFQKAMKEYSRRPVFKIAYVKINSILWPILGGPLSGDPIRIESQVIEVNVPILSVSFSLLSRLEELWATEFDQFGNFRPEDSLLPKDELMTPWIDRWIFELGKLVGFKHMAKFYFLPTFDLDYIESPQRSGILRSFKAIVGDIIRRGDIHLALRRSFSFALRRHEDDPCFKAVAYILNELDKRELSAIFFLKIGQTNSKYDQAFSSSLGLEQKLFESLVASNHMIGLHPSFDTVDRIDILENELDLLLNRFECFGYRPQKLVARQHYLRWRHCIWSAYEKLGIVEDHSLAYSRTPGFRCGTSIPFQAFDPVLRKKLNLVVIPPSIMDSTFYSESDRTAGDLESAFGTLVNETRHSGGQMTAIFHNSHLISANERKLFLKLLKKVSS